MAKVFRVDARRRESQLNGKKPSHPFPPVKIRRSISQRSILFNRRPCSPPLNRLSCTHTQRHRANEHAGKLGVGRQHRVSGETWSPTSATHPFAQLLSTPFDPSSRRLDRHPPPPFQLVTSYCDVVDDVIVVPQFRSSIDVLPLSRSGAENQVPRLLRFAGCFPPLQRGL